MTYHYSQLRSIGAADLYAQNVSRECRGFSDLRQAHLTSGVFDDIREFAEVCDCLTEHGKFFLFSRSAMLARIDFNSYRIGRLAPQHNFGRKTRTQARLSRERNLCNLKTKSI
jgi:hypothetical protein